MAETMTLPELHDAIAKAIADAQGHGMREKCERHADAVLAIVGPQLLANAASSPSSGGGGLEGEVPSIERIGWDKECDDVDRIIEKLGMTIEQARTEGGCLHLPRILNHIQETLDALALATEFGGHMSDKYVAAIHAANHPPAQAAQAVPEWLIKGLRLIAGTDGAEVGSPRGKAAELLARLSATAEPVAQGESDVAKFGHHPDPATDFCVEVEALLGEIENRRIGFENGTPNQAELDQRIERAMSFRVGGDPHAVMAKQQLRAATTAEPVPGGQVLVRESMVRHWQRELNAARQGDNAQERSAHVHASITTTLAAAPSPGEPS